MDVAERQAFIERIRADHHHDLPRLIYADWLEEQGDTSQADFIRVQCANARTTDDPPSFELAKLRNYEAELSTVSDKWAENIRPFVEGYAFNRGLLEAVTVKPIQLAKLPEAIFAEYPLRRFRLMNLRECPKNLGQSRHLRHIGELDLSGTIISAEFANTLARAKHLRNLELIDLSVATFTENEARTLFCSPVAQQLSEIRLWAVPATISSAVNALFESQFMDNLRVLDIRDNQATPGLLARLFQGFAQLPKLREVHLGRNQLGNHASGIDVFPLLKHITEESGCLDLTQNDIRLPFIQQLIAQPWLSTIRKLTLDLNYLHNDGLIELIRCPAFTQLEQLSVQHCHITDDAVYELATCPLLDTLRHVNLRGNLITQGARNRLVEMSRRRHGDRFLTVEAEEIVSQTRFDRLTYSPREKPPGAM